MAPPSQKIAARHVLFDSESQCRTQQQVLEAVTGDKEGVFKELAREYSTCPSGAKGGDLGSFGPGQMVKEFDDVLFQLAPGGTSSCFSTQFGWHMGMRTS